MKKLLLSLFTLVLLFAFSSGAQATSFTFSGTDPDIGDIGTGSATMNIVTDSTSITATLENTSPIFLPGYTALDVNGFGGNAPGITGFGFDLYEPLPYLLNWSLKAQLSDLSGSVFIGGSGLSGGEWILNTTMAGVTLDFFPTTDQENIDGALYNPDFQPLAATAMKVKDEETELLLPSGSNNVFYTEAILTLNFDAAPLLDTTSPFVRMQNVGLNGEGSLKLYAPPGGGGGGGVIPEPATMLLLGSGLIGIAVSGKKKFKKRNG